MTYHEDDDRPVRAFEHLGQWWYAVLLDGKWFAEDWRKSHTGPFSTAREAEEWVKLIVPA